MSTMYSGPKALGRAIKDRVFEETGLIISAGLAPNKFLAKLASDLDKPDGLVVIPYGREKEILAPLPIKRIWGVGPRTEKILKTGGFHLMRHYSKRCLIEKQFNSPCGQPGAPHMGTSERD